MQHGSIFALAFEEVCEISDIQFHLQSAGYTIGAASIILKSRASVLAFLVMSAALTISLCGNPRLCPNSIYYCSNQPMAIAVTTSRTLFSSLPRW